jgi:hypothetical protein
LSDKIYLPILFSSTVKLIDAWPDLAQSYGRIKTEYDSVDGILPAGAHSVRFDASGLATGVYLYRLESGGQMQVRRMVLVR